MTYFMLTIFGIVYLLVWLVTIRHLIVAFVDMLMLRAKNDRRFRNDILSCLYFFKDMAPNISSVSIVALFVVTPSTMPKLIALFIFGLLMKRLARRAISAFCEVANCGEEKKD